MILRHRHLLLPVLALSMSLVTVASVHAQNRQGQRSNGMSATFQVTLGSAPHWSNVRGTHVKEMRAGERPDYDMFRYGNKYYVYNDNRWFTSGRSRGQFNAVDDRAVPSELSRVPRDHWHNYPSTWGDQNRDARSNGNGQRHDAGAQPTGDRDHH